MSPITFGYLCFHYKQREQNFSLETQLISENFVKKTVDTRYGRHWNHDIYSFSSLLSLALALVTRIHNCWARSTSTFRFLADTPWAISAQNFLFCIMRTSSSWKTMYHNKYTCKASQIMSRNFVMKIYYDFLSFLWNLFLGKLRLWKDCVVHYKNSTANRSFFWLGRKEKSK